MGCAGRATETDAAVIPNEDEEKRVKTEDLVLIANKCGNKVLAVCRGGLGSNENLGLVPSRLAWPPFINEKHTTSLSPSLRTRNLRLGFPTSLRENWFY